jgi:hypothetical protein
MARDRSWIVLAEDGRHVSLGRASDPDAAELASLTDGLTAQNLGGWLAVMQGDYYGGRVAPSLLLVRALTPVSVDWESAVAAFQQKRVQALSAA